MDFEPEEAYYGQRAIMLATAKEVRVLWAALLI